MFIYELIKTDIFFSVASFTYSFEKQKYIYIFNVSGEHNLFHLNFIKI